MAYPLQPLLNVRSFREDNAQAAVSAAEGRVQEAEAIVAERQAELERYREWRVQEAEKVVDERKAELQTAREALLAARKDKMKIDAHKDIWSQAEAKEAERAADIELEDFVPKTALGDPGQEEDN